MASVIAVSSASVPPWPRSTLGRSQARDAANAEEGLSAIDEQPPDLILLDVMMPHVDGWEMLQRLQDRHGVGSIPVLMFSGKVDDETGEAAKRGASGFIGKPFDPQQLIERAKQLVPA